MESSEDIYATNLDNAKYLQGLAEREGRLESPINLNISKMTEITLNPLLWSNYDVPPKKLKLTNTGHTVILSAKWQRERPYITDGPFLGNYVFSQIHFHWGVNEMTGSEHHVDGGSMPMEMHVVHFKSEYLSPEVAMRHNDGIAILVYLFKLQSLPNASLDFIIETFPFIKHPHTSTRQTLLPMTTILRPFTQDYFAYWGSMTSESNSSCILWIVTREPIGISSEQIAEFRTLNDVNNEPLVQNCRTLQDIQNRNVYHVCPSGNRYATLLLIPSYPPPKLASQVTDEAAVGKSFEKHNL